VIGRLLEMRALRWVGRMSYSFYLWQTPFFGPGTPTGVAVLQTFPWNVCAAFGAAAVSYYAIERPMIRIGHRLTARSSVPAAMARASEAPAF